MIPLINEPYDKIRREVSGLVNKVTPEDLILFYFSGHGKLDSKHMERLYFTTTNTEKSLTEGRGKYIMTASTATQTAAEKEGDKYSVFTKHLINGLKTGEADLEQSGQITIDDLYKYTYDKVTKEIRMYPNNDEWQLLLDKLVKKGILCKKKHQEGDIWYELYHDVLAKIIKE